MPSENIFESGMILRSLREENVGCGHPILDGRKFDL